MNAEKGERQLERNLRAPVMVKDPFSEDIMLDNSSTFEVSLPVLVKVSGVVEAVHLGGSCEPVHQLWPQFTLVSEQVIVAVTG